MGSTNGQGWSDGLSKVHVPIGKVGSNRRLSMYELHCSAKACATSGKVRERYLPRELRTNCFGLGCSVVGMMGGRLRNQ